VRFSGGVSASTGFVALVLTLLACEEVTTFGMGGGRRPVGHPYQYFEWKRDKAAHDDAHSLGAEEAVLYSLAHAGSLTLCTLGGCRGLHPELADASKAHSILRKYKVRPSRAPLVESAETSKTGNDWDGVEASVAANITRFATA
jgi:hypothetical protein